VTNNIAIEAIAASTRHVASVTGSKLSAGKVNVGSVWVLPPTVTLQYHFLTQERFSPYLGAGISVDWFYNSQPMSGLNRISFTNSVGPALQAGFDYSLGGHWSVNADVKQIFINTTASVNSGFVKAKTALNPTVFGLGVGYRF
jgi:outer membrane protein